MRINKLFDEKDLVVSIEIFSPSCKESRDYILKTLDCMDGFKPDYMGITYNDFRGINNSITYKEDMQCLLDIKDNYKIEILPHIIGDNIKGEFLDDIIEDFHANNIENLLVLKGRGLLKKELSKKDMSHDFKNILELIKFIDEEDKFSISSVCYPDTLISKEYIENDVENIIKKVEFGANHFICKPQFNNSNIYSYINIIDQKQLNIPIEVGILPITNMIELKMLDLYFNDLIPEKVLKMLHKYAHDEKSLRDIGIAYALYQIEELIYSGIDGIHIYLVDEEYVTKKIFQGLNKILRTKNGRRKVKLTRVCKEMFYD